MSDPLDYSNLFGMPFIFPDRSSQNFTLTVSNSQSPGVKIQLNRLVVFKGFAYHYKIPLGSDSVSTENFDTNCTHEMVGGNHVVCLVCRSDKVYGIQPEKIACVDENNLQGMNFGPEKGGNLHPNLRVFCPYNYAFLPLQGGASGGCDQECSNQCFRCQIDNTEKCLSCTNSSFILDGSDSCIS